MQSENVREKKENLKPKKENKKLLEKVKVKILFF